MSRWQLIHKALKQKDCEIIQYEQNIQNGQRTRTVIMDHVLSSRSQSATNDIIESVVQEHHDGTISGVELTTANFEQPNTQIFVINRSYLVSMFSLDRRPPIMDQEPSSWASRTRHAVCSNLIFPSSATTDNSVVTGSLKHVKLCIYTLSCVAFFCNGRAAFLELMP